MDSIYYSDSEFTEILLEIEKIIEESEKSPFQNTKDLVKSVLKYFDLLHREPLARMVKLINSNHPELKEQLESDYTIKTLFKLYDLMEGEIEKSTLADPNITFIPEEDVGFFPPIIKSKKP